MKRKNKCCFLYRDGLRNNKIAIMWRWSQIHDEYMKRRLWSPKAKSCL